ncbi:MAG TPA: hypothetical protein VJ022_07620 [Anaerolineales bacterium]|nr:hypothetical protein [Anaerolineales bacterium]
MSRALQITWKHKVLWLFSALPGLVGFLVFPIMIVPIFFLGMDSRGNLVLFENPIFIILFVGFNVLVSVVSFLLYTLSTASVTLGIFRVEGDAETLHFRDLMKDGMNYFLRILGVGLLIGVGISAIFLAFFWCLTLFGMVTMGIGFICAQPLIILMYPVMMILYALIEQSHAAVVVDDLGVTQAISRSWGLIKENFWRILLLTLVIYFGVSILSSIVLVPFMLPFFFIPFLIEGAQLESNMQLAGLILGAFGLILLAVLAFVQGVTITFMKSTYVLLYLRLTRPSDVLPEIQEAAA